MFDQKILSFAYNYPFTDEAKLILKNEKLNLNDSQNLLIAQERVQEAIDKEEITYKNITYNQISHIISYPYARMIISAIKNPYLLNIYVSAETKRCIKAMNSDTYENIERLSNQLGVIVRKSEGNYKIDIITFLNSASNSEGHLLVNQQLKAGYILMDKQQFIGMFYGLIYSKIKLGLPIDKSKIPMQVLEYSKSIKVKTQKLDNLTGHSEDWIENLLVNPIPDVRQRVVNLILAPYLINVKKLDIETAYKQIVEYIDKCRVLDPNTKITNAQIKYQCEYSKSKGMRPLSIQKANELLSGVVDINAIRSSK